MGVQVNRQDASAFGTSRFLGRIITVLAVLLCASTAPAQSGDAVPSWPRRTLALDLNNPDLSYLNHKPAGAHGRVRAAGEDLVFEDGSIARFWGVNLQASALFRTTPANIRAHARRIASLGFNLVRLHHHDSDWVSPNVFGMQAPGTRRLDPDSLAQLDLWISALRAEGIYIWLDLHVGRRFTPLDGLRAFDEMAHGKPTVDIRGFNFVSDDIQTYMLEFQTDYLNHLNPYSGLRYSEDPAIIAVLITNENDVTHHFANRLLPDKNVPVHTALYLALARDFAQQHALDPQATWKSWEFGPSKIFLNDLEWRFFQAMLAGVRRTGFDGLVAPTSTWGRNSVAALPSLTSGSIIDVHSYGLPGELSRDPREAPGFLDWVAAAQVAGMPLSISEWNAVRFPAQDRFVAPLRMAASATYQGWDAPMVYGYAQVGLNHPLNPSNWAIAHDPAIMAMMPAAALLFRESHVAPAGRTYALRLPAGAFYGRRVAPDTSVALRTLTEQGRLVVDLPPTPELSWLAPAPPPREATPVTDIDHAFLADGAREIASDTGEIRRDFVRGLFTVDTARTQLAAGNLAGGPIRLSTIALQSDLPMAAVAVQSLDGRPISRSQRIMISLSARAAPVSEQDPAFAVEPMTGELRLTAPPELELTGGNGMPLAAGAVHRLDNGQHVIDLASLDGAPWVLLKAPVR